MRTWSFCRAARCSPTSRVVDAKEAIESTSSDGVRLDPGFAAAYVNLARGRSCSSPSTRSPGDRQVRFETRLAPWSDAGRARPWRSTRKTATHICSARSLRRSCDLATAEADYRRGLELSPNSAEGHAGLAAVLYATPSRRDEALKLLDRARRLDPLEPAYDVTKSVFLFDELSDVEGCA